eukprot:scaffold669_cov80-Cylindrotheca_fusiformis.AAC.1
MPLETYLTRLLRENNAEYFAIVRDNACSTEPSTKRARSPRNSSRPCLTKTGKPEVRRFESGDSYSHDAAPKMPTRTPARSNSCSEENQRTSELLCTSPRNTTFSLK